MKKNNSIPVHSRVYLLALKRIRDIHREIASESHPGVSDLARLLEVSERTVKRDLAMMRDGFNAPVIYEKRKGGFRYSEPGWALPLQRISEGELLAFFIAENALRFTGQTAEAVLLKSSLAKLAAMLPEQISINIAGISEMTSFQNLPAATVEPAALEKLAQAAISQQTIEFDYYSPHSQIQTRRKADPHFLHNFAGDWYVISYDHMRKAMRDFHIGRISDLRVTNDIFTPQKSFDAAEYLNHGFYMTRGGRSTMVEIVFDRYQAQWIRERKFFHPDETREEIPGGGLRLSFKIGEKGLEAVARFCMTYAGHCIAEKPEKLRELIKEKAQKAYEEH